MSTIRTIFDNCVKNMPSAPAQTFYRGQKWVTRTYRELYDRVTTVAEAASKLNINPARDKVAIMMENSPEWTEIYLAYAGAGVTVVPIDPKLCAGEMSHILNDSKSSILFIGAALKKLIKETLPNLPFLRHVVLVDSEGGSVAVEETDDSGRFLCFDALIKKAAELKEKAGEKAGELKGKAGEMKDSAKIWFDKHIPSADSIASIIYTSGTTGRPKGAILSHRNFCANADSTVVDVPLTKKDNFFVILPLFHAYSFMANLIVPLRVGARISFMKNLRTVSDDIKALSPTVIMTVPLMAEKMYAKIMPKIQKSFMAKVMIWIGLKRIVARKVIKQMGGKLRFFGIGGAPCPADVFKGFRKIGFPIIEGYGITECAPGVVYGRLDKYHPGYVGRLIHGMEMRIVHQNEYGVGELQVKGDNVTTGYFNDEAATAEAFEDGWFRTGDLCEVTKEGLIAIRGRKKALIVNREGKNIYPEEIEICIAEDKRIADTIVLGYRTEGETGERVGCIVTPNMEAIEETLSGKMLAEHEIVDLLEKIVADRCRNVAKYKRPRKIEVRLESLQRTSSMKVRRAVYAGALDE